MCIYVCMTVSMFVCMYECLTVCTVCMYSMCVCVCMYVCMWLPSDGGDHVHGLVEHGHGSRAQSSAFVLQVVEIHHHLWVYESMYVCMYVCMVCMYDAELYVCMY